MIPAYARNEDFTVGFRSIAEGSVVEPPADISTLDEEGDDVDNLEDLEEEDAEEIEDSEAV